jgi:S-formylglutathione hydrolase FrmB
MLRRYSWTASLLVCCLLVTPIRAAGTKALEFHLTFDKTVTPEPFTGRVYVMVSQTRSSTEPPLHLNWFDPEPLFAVDVKDWKPGDTRILGAAAIHHKIALDKLPKGQYWVQAIIDVDQGGHSFAKASGNGYSKPVKLALDPAATGPVKIRIDQVYKEPAFKETQRLKLVDIESRLLSQFHKKPIHLRAGVALPKSYAAKQDQRYPVVYEIPGFGGNHEMAKQVVSRNGTDIGGVEMLYVVLDPDCRTGHHVFADSDNNGPYGQALIEELIPHIEKTFRAIATPPARFLTGHSSGGWSSLWLQVTYPDYFGSTWSTSPDPVDFRDFQMVNIYKDANIFTDDAGKPRPLARYNKQVMMHYKPFSDMEVVMGRGGQLQSFEAVFSPRGADGKPQPLWDRTTGKIDHEVAKTWQRYDIRLILERSWKTLGPKLAGKIRVYMGTEDNFYLEGATLLLKQSQNQLKSDAVIELFPGRDHMDLLDAKLRQRIATEMAEQFRKSSAKK